MPYDKQDVAKRLRELREESRMTQEQVAAAAGVDVGTVHNYERGRTVMRCDAAWRLADCYGVGLDDMVCRGTTDEREPKDQL